MEPRRILDIADVVEKNVAPSQWTAVVPAAGKGSRLGHHLPKILYPLLGRPILEWLVDALRATADTFVFILSPDGQTHVEPYLKKTLGERCRVAIQQEPTGMGDAVLLAEEHVSTPYTLVVWGDQVLLNSTTVTACAAVHQSRPAAALTLPAIVKRDPYINFVRNAKEQIVGVQQARENEIDAACGENDCGLFLFSTAALFSILSAARHDPQSVGTSTSEFNLLQTLPLFETGPGSVATVRIADETECQGVNTPEEAQIAERELQKRRENSTV